MKNFRTLELATEFYGVIEAAKITGHLREQLLRAASSVALNLSEGNAKFSVKEKKRFYQMSYASLQECKTILTLLKVDDEVLVKKADHLGASLYKLMKSEITSILNPGYS